jgi:phosphatidylglycerophosphatase A
MTMIKNHMSLAISSGLYIGFIPGAPGTYGSVATTLVFFLIYCHFGTINPVLHLGAVGLITVAGIIASSIASGIKGEKDPSFVVIDEVAGQLVTFLLLPVSAMNMILGTIAFRLFDIWKPYPIKKLESLDKGVGIMADDLLAGIYANLVLQLVNLII